MTDSRATPLMVPHPPPAPPPTHVTINAFTNSDSNLAPTNLAPGEKFLPITNANAHSAPPSIIPSLGPSMVRMGLLSPSPHSSPSNNQQEFSFSTGPLDAQLSGYYYPGLLESMRLDSRATKARGKILATQSWKKILTFVIESAKQNSGNGGLPGAQQGGPGGGLPTGGGKKKDVIPPPRSDLLRGFGAGEEVYGLGGGYNPLAKDRVRGSGSGGGAGGGKNARFREPDTEAWQQWHTDEWKAWKEWRVREKERLAKLANGGIFIPQRDGGPSPLASIGPAALLAAGVKTGRQGGGGAQGGSNASTVDPELLLATAAAKLKRDDLKSSMDLNLDLNPLDHIHTVRHTHIPHTSGSGGKKKALKAAHAKLRASDTKFQREQKVRAAELYRNIWIQQMKVMKSNKALSHYSEMWDRKLNGYKMTLERDAQGNRIRALHLLDEKTKKKVLQAQNGVGDTSLDFLNGEEGEGEDGESGSDGAEESSSSSDDEPTGGEGGPSIPSVIKKLQASNPHKHIYQGSMSARNTGRHAQSMAELAASSISGLDAGTLSARARESTAGLPGGSVSNTFECMLNSGLALAQAQSAQKSRAPNLFARAILGLKNRKVIVSFSEPEMAELKEIFDTLARDGYSKITKTSFKSIIATNFALAGNGSLAQAQQAQAAGKDASLTTTGGGSVSTNMYVDRARLDPLLDRLWLAVNSSGRNSNLLDFADFSQMIGLRENGTLEDKASFSFELYDMDDDGVLDIHDLFVCLHLALDEYFPSDFKLIAENLYEKMEQYERIWKRRQEKIMELAAAGGNGSQANLRRQGSVLGSGSQSARPYGSDSNATSMRDLNLAHDTSNASFHSTSISTPYVHQELPVLHITKAEYVRMHQQACAAATAAAAHAQAQAAAAASSGTTHDPSNPFPLHAPHPPHPSDHRGGAASFRSASLSAHHGSAAQAATTVQPHQIDLIELIPKAFLLPYRKSSTKQTTFNLGGNSAREPGFGGQGTLGAGGGGQPRSERERERERERDRERDREREKEKLLAQAGKATLIAAGYNVEEKQATSSAASKLLPVTHAIRVASHVRRSVHNMDEFNRQSSVPSHHASPSTKLTGLLLPGLADATASSGTQPSEIDQLLIRIRTTSNSRLSKSVFRKIFMAYLANGPNHQFHALNPAQAAIDIAEEEKIVEFLFYALDVQKNGSLDGQYTAAMLGFVLKGEPDAQLKFYQKLLDLDRDGFVTAKDLCLAHDLTNSYTLRTDLKVLLDVFSNKIEQVILNTRRTVHEIEERNRPHINLRDVLPDPTYVPPADGQSTTRVSTAPKDTQDLPFYTSDPAQAVHSQSGSAQNKRPVLMDQHQQLAQLRLHAHVGITIEEFHDALLKFNPSLFLKILKRVPYQREKRFQAAVATIAPRAGLGKGAHKDDKDGEKAHHGAHGHGAAAGGAQDGSVGFEDLYHLHRSMLRELKVSTQIDFSSKFPDAHNSNIGDQITTLRRSLDFQQDCQFETRIFYLANQFGVSKPSVQGSSGTQPSLQSLQAAHHDSAYNSIQRLLTRVPQVYVTWTLLQDGSKHMSIETAKFRKASVKYNLLSKTERRKARFKMIATPGSIYAYGGFPRPKTGDLDRADLQHYGTPLRCILLSVSGAQLNEEGLDDIDFIKVNPETNEKFLDQPQFFYELCTQVHMWLSGFVEMVELENIRAVGGHIASSGSTGSISLQGQVKTGLMRVVRIGAGNFAAVQGLKEHQGNLIAYLLMHAFLFNLRKNQQVIHAQPQPQSTPIVTSPKYGHHGKSGSTASTSATAAAARPITPAVPPPPPAIVSGYKNLSVIEFIFFDDDACPILKDPLDNDRRMCGGVELRFSKRDVLELTTHQTSHHHIGILNPMDSFAIAGNEEGYTSLASMIGNNTSLRLMQSYHFNMHLLHQPNYIPIDLAPELSTPTFDPILWKDIKSVLTHEKSPKRWLVDEPDEVEEEAPSPPEEEESKEDEYDPEDINNLTTDM